DAEEDRGRLRRGRQDHGDAVAALDAVRCERVGRLIREVLQLAPVELTNRAVEALPDHRLLVARVLVADVGGDVVARRHLPPMRGAYLVIARRAHPRTRGFWHRAILPVCTWSPRSSPRSRCRSAPRARPSSRRARSCSSPAARIPARAASG